MNKVDELLEKPFSSLKYEEKLEVKKLGPYQPKDVHFTQQDGKRIRTFCPSWFEKTQWLTISEDKNSLFCFYCLLFGGEDMWSHTGCKDLKHLADRVQKHENSKTHLSNAVQFIMFGKENVLTSVDYGHLSIIKHNELVTNNRHTLSRIVDCIKFCCMHELPLRKYNEPPQSCNHGVLLDMISYTSNFDYILNYHLEKCKLTANYSENIEDELLDCIYQVYIDEIKNEINKANFVSVQIDETSCINCLSQFAIILRYSKDSQPVERFLNFINIHHRTTAGFVSVLKEELKSFSLISKLIAQSYDGTAIMRHASVKMRECYQHAQCVHCYAHNVNLIVENVCSSSKRLKLFFVSLNLLVEFFMSSNKHNGLLQAHCQSSWCFQSRTINYVKENKTQLIECCNRVQNEDGWDDKSIFKSEEFTRLLRDYEFNFLVSLFDAVLKHIDILYSELQSNKFNRMSPDEALKNFSSSVTEIQVNITSFLPVQDDNDGLLPTPLKRKKKDTENTNSLVLDATDICKQIILEMYDRFKNFELLRSYVVVDPKHFSANNQCFPIDRIYTITKSYPMLNKDKLISELTVMYESKSFSNINNVNTLSKFLKDNGLLYAFSEVSKLIEIVIATPASTSDAVCCFNTSQCIKTFLKNTSAPDRLNALAVLSVHKDFIHAIPQFNQKVIEKFAQIAKEREAYLYK